MATSGTEGWRLMAKCPVGFISISRLIGVWSMITADERQGVGEGMGRMGLVAGMKSLLNTLRAAMPEGIVVMVS
jgi:hypothetical protein